MRTPLPHQHKHNTYVENYTKTMNQKIGQRWAVPSTKVPRYFFNTDTGTDVTFPKMVPKYRYRGAFFQKSIRYFQCFAINHILKIKLSLSLWRGVNKFLTPKYTATVRPQEGFKVWLPIMSTM